MHESSKKLKESDSTALVLSGGFTKAAFWHAGVVLGLEEYGYSIDGKKAPGELKKVNTIVGSSAGALVGGILSNGFSALDVIEAQLPPYNGKIPRLKYSDIFDLKNVLNTKGYVGFKNIRNNLKSIKDKPGIFSTNGLRDFLKQHIVKNNSYSSYDMDFFVTATQLDHSRKCVFGKYKFPNPKHDPTTHYYVNFPVAETISASMSIPVLFEPVGIKNPNTGEYNYFLDGEIRDTLSTHVAVDNNCKTIISSWIYTPYHYQRDIGSLYNYGLSAVGIQSLNLLIQKKIVSARANFSASRDILQTVNQYCIDQKLPNSKRKKLLNILETKLHFKESIKFIDIYPKVSDTDFFFLNAMTLKPKNIENIVTLAKARTIEVLNSEL